MRELYSVYQYTYLDPARNRGFSYYSRAHLEDSWLPLDLVEDVVETWDAFFDKERLVLPNGWSNDWWNFKYLDHWILPTPRWNLQDAAFARQYQLIIRTRSRLGLLGDIIPIAYEGETHESIVFCVGPPPYFCSFSVVDLDFVRIF